MRDIPVFVTQYGTAQLICSQIPYTRRGYIRVLEYMAAEKLLAECAGFLQALDCQEIYYTGLWQEGAADTLWEYTVGTIPSGMAKAIPVTEENKALWISLYNRKAEKILGSAHIGRYSPDSFFEDCYFIYKEDTLLGIGKAAEDEIQWISSHSPGAGAEVVKALGALCTFPVRLQVLSSNNKAVALYESLGFQRGKELARWYAYKK